MHGRQKVDRTPEENAQRDKERAKKCTAYRHAMKIIFDKRSKQEYDQDLLKITSQVLSANPDISTLWNIRREVLLFIKGKSVEEFTDLVPNDFNLTEVCLRSNPKSYGAWFHRSWLMREINFATVKEEIQICAKYLKLDDRNFHCWDYRRFLINNCPQEMTLKQELEFTTEKIVSNFSNYSSWHLRSTILPDLSSDYLIDELDLIKNAAFTDPNDQSVWFYHRWLVLGHLVKPIKSNNGPTNTYEPKDESCLKMLLDEMTWLKELQEIEPDNKWVILTLVNLMSLINIQQFKPEIEKFIPQLKDLDPSRKNYYIYLEKNFSKRWAKETASAGN